MSLTTISCGECGIKFCLPENRLRELKRSHETFYCPNGLLFCAKCGVVVDNYDPMDGIGVVP